MNDGQALVNHPSLTDENIRDALFRMDQDVTTQVQLVTTQAQSMKTQANQEVVHRANKQVATMASCLIDITRMNPQTIYGSNV